MQQLPTSFSEELRAIGIRLLAYVCGIACLAVFTAELVRTSPVVPASEPIARPEWISVERPAAAFDASLHDLAEEPRYAIRRHLLGGRKDILTFGEPGRSVRFAMIEIYRPGSELQHFGAPSEVVATRAKALEPAGDMRVSFPIDTKFGSFATVDFATGHFGGGHCIGFVHSASVPRLQISGLVCNMEAIVDRIGVACLLDRLTLLSAGSDRAVAGYFARAEVNRKFCGQRDPLMYATPRHQTPATEAPQTVRLRGTFAAR